jgi:MoaA/NifB/PqqE/SkfB family radical SAM enzyme
VENLKDFVASSFLQPKEIHLESSSRCNGACITCPRQGMTRYQGEMSRVIFLKVVDECKEYGWVLDYFHFHLNGEPLYLDIDELCWRINYAKEHLPKRNEYPIICFFTNASLLTEEKSRKLLASPLDKIVFSVDGGTKEAFEKMRPGLKWEEVVGNITKFMEVRKEVGSKIPTQTAFIPCWENKDSLLSYYKLFNSLGIDDVGGSGVNNIGGLIDSKAMRLPEQYTKGHKKNPCWRVFIDLSICADGKAVVCCQDVRGKCVIGDANKETVKQIWQYGMEQVRQIHLRMEQEQIEFCKDCDYMESFCISEDMQKWWPMYKEV